VLSDISVIDDGYEIVNLPFAFQWRGQVNYIQVVVDSNGLVYPGNVTKLGDMHSLALFQFIGVWWQDLVPSIAGNIYVANVDGVFVISWEGVPQYDGGLPDNSLNFQVALHPGGNIEIRWGDGNPPIDRDTSGRVGIFDDAAGVAVPATRFSFDNEAYGAGFSARFPSNQCQIFVVTAVGNYIEWLWT
jgi:hypothetical protein